MGKRSVNGFMDGLIDGKQVRAAGMIQDKETAQHTLDHAQSGPKNGHQCHVGRVDILGFIFEA